VCDVLPALCRFGVVMICDGGRGVVGVDVVTWV
jgi:hypothetical protein